MVLMNTACNMSQFIGVVPIPDESSSTLAEYFFQHVLMKVNPCHRVDLDDGNPFKGVCFVMSK